MSGFNAGSVVKPLNWNFNPYAAYKGVIPEPSQDAVEKFFEQLQTAARKAQVIGADASITSSAEAEEALASISEDMAKAREINDEVEEALAELCGGCPTLDQIRELPHRPRLAFSRWLMKELRPEG